MKRSRVAWRGVPPRAAETLLAGLVADGGVRDAMLGDLAEEFEDRCSHIGPRGAVSWYWRQALAAVPPLLHATVAASPRSLLLEAALGYVAAGTGLVAFNGLLSFVILPRVFAPSSTAFCVAFTTLSLIAVASLCGAWASHWYRRAPRAPIAESVVSGAIWLIVGGVWITAGAGSSPLWYQVSLHLAGIAGTALAALVAVRDQPPAINRRSC